ncbi:MAG: zinc ribbon domain-containing protein, partial [Spirulinaceae cyanobacterium]
QTCHKCLHLGMRGGKSFRCTNPQCQHQGDADVNAAKVIALWGCSVNQPGGSELLSCTIIPGLLKAKGAIGARLFTPSLYLKTKVMIKLNEAIGIYLPNLLFLSGFFLCILLRFFANLRTTNLQKLDTI